MPATDVFVLLFDSQKLRIAGEVLEGEVCLYFDDLKKDRIQQVYIELRGSILTSITSMYPGNSNFRTIKQTVELFHSKVSLWSEQSAWPADQRSDAALRSMILPFQFLLPSELPPSCEFSHSGNSGRVEYCIEVVGVRPVLHRNRKVVCSFLVMPLSTGGARLSQALVLREPQLWRQVIDVKHIRRGFMGEYSRVSAVLLLPEITEYPVYTPIPFGLRVTTITKPMEYYEDIPLDQSIFPEPPWSPDCGLEFTLTRSVLIRAHRERFGLGGELVAHLTGFNFGLARSHDTSDLLQVESRKRIWMPISADGKSKMGSWKQRVEFKTSTFTLRCPPSLRSDTMNVAYQLNLKVPFQGIGNDLKITVPIEVVSNMRVPSQGPVVPLPTETVIDEAASSSCTLASVEETSSTFTLVPEGQSYYAPT